MIWPNNKLSNSCCTSKCLKSKRTITKGGINGTAQAADGEDNAGERDKLRC